MFSKSDEKKIRRKQKRSQHLINSDSGVNCCDEPTQNLAVCNAGLSTGLQQEQLLSEIAHFGAISDIVMLKGKSYCFVRCSSVESAISIYGNVHGKSTLGQNNGPLYLSYCDEVPENGEAIGMNLPNGLMILPEFVSEEEEHQFIDLIDWSQEINSAQTLKHRQVKHFGYEFRYDNNRVDASKPLSSKIPPVCSVIFRKLTERYTNPCIPSTAPDQLTVNKYEPGQGIPPHVDTHSAFLDPIVVLSVAGDVVMDWTRPGAAEAESRRESVLVPRRSLMIMSGESRYGWTHGITPRKNDIVQNDEAQLTSKSRTIRISFTFRWLKHDSCTCSYPSLCDSQKEKCKPESSESRIEAPSDLEQQNVHKVYNEIANHFSETRHSPWPQVEEFVCSFASGSVLVDIGCGNGKYLSLNSNIAKIGCDRSDGLLKVCRERQFQVFQCDCLAVPMRSQSVDGAISIAVIHHLASEERRLQAVREMARILRPAGRALIYVWAKNQAVKTTSSYLRQNKRNFSDKPAAAGTSRQERVEHGLPVHTNRTQFEHQDILVPWKLKEKKEGQANADAEGNTFLRFYHVFEENELEELCRKVGDISIVKSYHDQGNWCLIFEKIQ